VPPSPCIARERVAGLAVGVAFEDTDTTWQRPSHSNVYEPAAKIRWPGRTPNKPRRVVRLPACWLLFQEPKAIEPGSTVSRPPVTVAA